MPQIIRNSADLKQCLTLFCGSIGEQPTDDMLKEILFENLEEVHTEPIRSHRWWNTIYRVVKLPFEYSELGYLLIRFEDAETSGDRSPEEAGWQFDWNSLEEVEPVEVIIIRYVKRT